MSTSKDNKQKGRGNWFLLSEYLNANGISYNEYLRSEHWQDVRQRFLASGLCTIWGRKKCWACHKQGKLNVHHKTYIRLGREHLTDLQLLCDDCHREFHESIEKQDNLWKTSKKFLRNKKKEWQKKHIATVRR